VYNNKFYGSKRKIMRYREVISSKKDSPTSHQLKIKLNTDSPTNRIMKQMDSSTQRDVFSPHSNYTESVHLPAYAKFRALLS